MNADLISRVWQRARSRCEYCQLPAAFHLAPFQMDHIVARQHGGATELENLASPASIATALMARTLPALIRIAAKSFACSIPDANSWTEHFVWNGPQLQARTQIGRVTIALLLINDPEVVAVRKALQEEGVFGG